jgi:polar amino acid transport system substrate-binding protein
MKRVFLFFLVYCLALQAELPLRVGMELSYPPFETLDTKGKPCGVSVDLAYALGNYLGREVHIENIPFIGLIPSLNTGKIDLILSSMTVTPEREKAIAFSDPYLSIGLCLLLSLKTEGSTLSDVDVKGNTIVVKLGTTAEAYAHAHVKNAKLMSLDKESSCVLEIVQSRANAFIYDQFSILRGWQNHPKTTRAVLNPIVRENWAMGIRKADLELEEQINAFLKDFRARGGFVKLQNKYFKEEQKIFKSQGVPFVFDTNP